MTGFRPYLVFLAIIYFLFACVDNVHSSSSCTPPQLAYPGGDGFALIPGPNATGYSTFHKHSPAELVMFDLVSGYRTGIYQMLQSYNTSTGNNLHGIQIINDRYYLYPVSIFNNSLSIDSWGIGCFDLVLMTDCSPNGGYTKLGPQPAFDPPVFCEYTGIYGLVPYGNYLYTVDQDNFLYCYDPSTLSACNGWIPYSFTSLAFPLITGIEDSQLTIDILPNSSRLYILRNDAVGVFQIRCLDLSQSPLGDMSCAGFLLPAVLENLYILGNKAFMLYFLQVPSLDTWYVCSSSYQGPQGCVDAFTGVTIVDIGLSGTFGGVPIPLADSFNYTTSILSLFQGVNSYGCTGKYRAGNKTYFSGIGRNGVICWDDSTNDFCLNSTGQYVGDDPNFPGMISSGMETRDYEVTYDPVSDCFFSLGDTDQPWSFDSDGNIPCQSKNGVYSIQLQPDYYEIPQNGSVSMNITANDLPLGKINQASVTPLLLFSNYSSFTSTTDSNGNVIFQFTAQNGTCGNYSFSYSACGLTSTDSVNSIIHINCPPTAVPDTIYFYPGSTSSALVTVNDTDPDLPNDYLTVASIPIPPQYGTATISSNGKSIFYTPFPGSFSADSLTYVVQDKFNQTSSPASISVLPLIPILSVSSSNGTTLQNGTWQSFSAPIGGNVSLTFSLSNIGLMNLTISYIYLPNDFTSNLSLPLLLTPGQSAVASISFNPSNGIPENESITIFSNDLQFGNFVINTNNQGNGPNLVVLNSDGSQITNGTLIAINGELSLSGQTQTFQIQNSGNQNLNLSSLSLSGTGYSLSSPFVSQIIASGQSINLSVVLNTTVSGSYSGILSLISNDYNNPTFSIQLNGMLLGPTLSLTENLVAITNGGIISMIASSPSSIIQNVTITNSGNQNLIISQISISGVGYSVSFSSQNPIVVSPGISTSVSISFSGSSSPGTFTGVLSISSNDPFNSNFSTTINTVVQIPSISVSYQPNSSVVFVANGGSAIFSEIPVNSIAVYSLNFVNNGTSPLSVSRVSIPSGFSMASGGNLSLSGYNVIQPGSLLVLSLSISTSTAGSVSGILTINTNDPSNAIFSINLSASVGQGSIAIASINSTSGSSSPIANGSSLGFGIIPSSSKINTTISISNPNPSSTLVIYPSSSFPSGLYPITSIPAGGLSIPPGGSISFTIGVNPSTTGQLNGTIVINNSDPTNPSFNIVVTGFVYFWNFVTPLAPNGTTKWIMYKNATISWNHNIGSHNLNLYMVNSNSNSISTLALSHSSSSSFSFSPSGVTLGNYFVKSVLLVSSTSQFKTVNGAQMFSPVVALSYS